MQISFINTHSKKNKIKTESDAQEKGAKWDGMPAKIMSFNMTSAALVHVWRARDSIWGGGCNAKMRAPDEVRKMGRRTD